MKSPEKVVEGDNKPIKSSKEQVGQKGIKKAIKGADDEDMWKTSYSASYKPFKQELYTVTFKNPSRKLIMGPYPIQE